MYNPDSRNPNTTERRNWWPGGAFLVSDRLQAGFYHFLGKNKAKADCFLQQTVCFYSYLFFHYCIHFFIAFVLNFLFHFTPSTFLFFNTDLKNGKNIFIDFYIYCEQILFKNEYHYNVKPFFIFYRFLQLLNLKNKIVDIYQTASSRIKNCKQPSPFFRQKKYIGQNLRRAYVLLVYKQLLVTFA